MTRILFFFAFIATISIATLTVAAPTVDIGGFQHMLDSQDLTTGTLTSDPIDVQGYSGISIIYKVTYVSGFTENKLQCYFSHDKIIWGTQVIASTTGVLTDFPITIEGSATATKAFILGVAGFKWIKCTASSTGAVTDELVDVTYIKTRGL